MTDSPDNVFSFGGGGKLYADAREAVDDIRREQLLAPDPPPWADHPEPDKPDKPDKKKDKAKPATVTQKNLPAEAGFDWRELCSTLLELAGVTAISVGGWLIAPYVGLIIAGVALMLFGAATSKTMRG